MKISNYNNYFALLSALFCLLTSCSDDDSTPRDAAAQEIHFNADVWHVMSNTRATTFDNTAALQEVGSFTCYAYNYDTDEVYEFVNGATASWNTSYWSIEGRPTWPGENSLDFFAYMPASMTNTHCTFDSTPYNSESNPDGYSVNSPRIVCTGLPVDITAGEDDTKELIYAYVAEKNKGNAGSGVELTFKRPFARVYFKKAEGLNDVTINSVKIAGIYNNGTCTFNGSTNPQTSTWVTSGSTTDLVVTGSPATGDTPYLVLPQTFASNLTFTVNATWTDWGNPTKDVSASVAVGSWEPGHSYTYTFSLHDEVLIVDTEKYTEQW